MNAQQDRKSKLTLHNGVHARSHSPIALELGKVNMGRSKTPSSKIEQVLALIKRGGMPIKAACNKVGIAPSTFYSHFSSSPDRFPRLSLDWRKLGETYSPTGIRNLGPAERQRLIIREVWNAFRQVFARPARVMTPKQRARKLRDLGKRLTSAVSAYDALTLEVISTIDELQAGHPMQSSIDSAIEIIRAHLNPISQRASELESIQGMAPHDRGGPVSDPRVRAIAERLAEIYSQFSREVPTHRTSPATGLSISPFDRFAGGAIKHFLHRVYPALFDQRGRPKKTIVSALQHAAARIDRTEEVQEARRRVQNMRSE